MVGIGASAGGLFAFEAFFSSMPADCDPGMAFVLVQHLAPDHKSILTEIIRQYTRMQVFEVKDGMRVQPNCTYIIPPDRDMAFLSGTLQLLKPFAPRGRRLPIDFFFCSLARDLREQAIGIVLSGTGSDGTLGIRAIKGQGGMVMAQNPGSAEYDGMPRSAISTGLVDYKLPPAKMPAQLMAYMSCAFGRSPLPPVAATPKTENALKKIFILLNAQTGHNFSKYKPGTIRRRIERRMAVHQIDNMDSYVHYLQQTTAEKEALFRDLLINVTRFFRDPQAFKVFEDQIIPKLFAGKPASAVIRVWSPGCSTGEEAYSLAILLAEQQEAMNQNFKVQIFATDIDSQAIATARAGIYPAGIAADISKDRLTRFFTVESDNTVYRIRKGIRDMLVFSEQSLTRDPPFSRLDLISCRNLLIYFDKDLQQKLIPLFHHTLVPGGFLFLGTSETVGEFSDLFSMLDRKAKLYQRKEDFGVTQYPAMDRFIPPVTAVEIALPNTAFAMKPSLRKLTEEALLQQVAPAAALVNTQGDILYLHGRTGLYLEPAQGDVGASNILKMAREGLKQELTIALHKIVHTNEIVRCPGLRVRTNGGFTMINLTLKPVAAGSSLKTPLYLVILEKAPMADLKSTPQDVLTPLTQGESLDIDIRIKALRQELQAKEEYLQATNEELETANEELKSSNEEMQSINEELQSSNEELETSREELQSVNEELHTVNNELQTKVADLSRTNNDMNNLMAGTNIATVFLDYHLRILRFTPMASRIINLIQSDVGRPVSHIVSNLVGYDGLMGDLQAVLDTLIPKEVEVQITDGSWHTMRIQPYRTLDNVIEGAVVTFVDITDMKKNRDALEKANEVLRMAVAVRDARDAVTVQDLDGRILAWNPGAVRMYGWSEAEALLMNVRDRIPKSLRKKEQDKVYQLSQAKILKSHLTQRIAKDGSILEVSIISTALVNKTGQMYAVTTTERTKVK
ncbi:MAG: CheR family methyltransferase [Pseudomonadota bacterium]